MTNVLGTTSNKTSDASENTSRTGTTPTTPVANTSQNWQRNGYPTQQAHEAAMCRVMISTLTRELTQELEDDEKEEDRKESPPKKRRWNRKITRNFFTCMKPKSNKIPSNFLGAAPLTPYEFKMSFKLPFLTFPIGDGETSNDRATLSGLADTGGCCNMGWLTYHREVVAKRYPCLVHKFTDLQEHRYKTISIGGLQGGVVLTHMIKYLIPYSDRGGACVLTLGLTEELPLDPNFQT
jgi:hypothetical protein